MKKFNLLFVLIFFTSTCIFSQIKVFPDGTTKIGVELPNTTSPANFDQQGLMKVSILGTQAGDNSGYSGGSRLSFGDVGVMPLQG